MRQLTGGRFPLLRFDRGEEFPAALEEWCASSGIGSAAVACGVGMLEETDLGVFDGTSYTHRIFHEPAEVLSIQGNVSMRDGRPFAHVHASLGMHDFAAAGGHLFRGRVAVTLEVLLCLLDGDLVRLPAEGPFRQLDAAKP